MNLKAIGAMFGIVPSWCWWLLVVLGIFLAGDLRGSNRKQAAWDKADEARNELVREVGRAQTGVVKNTEIVYRDFLQRIYVQGEANEKRVSEFITDGDDERYRVNAGFVRVFNAAWSGSDAGPAVDSDRGSSAVPLSEIAATESHNATSCLAWQKIALGLRENYRKLQEAQKGP